MKYVVVILDGAAGWPLAEQGGRTSLQAASTPNLDRIAREGLLGKALTVPAGAEPSSSAACTSILGYDPVADWVGRGAIEAASMGIALGPDQLALRLNLVTLEEGRMRSYSAGNITTEESRAIVSELAEQLDDDTFALHPGVAYRHILVVTGHPELMECSYTPPHDISDRDVAGHLPEGHGAKLLLEYMERARPILAASAVNARRAAEGRLAATDVWPFWPGAAPQRLTPFSARRGLLGAMSSGVDLLNGLAVLFGFERLSIAGVTGDSENDYAAQAEGALAALADQDLVVIHIEAPDEEGHAGDSAAKIAAIEAIDREVLARVLAFAQRGGNTRVLAMPDHPTPVAIKTHSADAVPFVVWGEGVASNGGEAFDEDAAERTGLYLDPGRRVMDALVG